MTALLYILLAAAWLEDGLLRRLVDKQLARRPLFGKAAWLAAGAILAASIVTVRTLDLPPMLQTWLDALSLVVVSACLAPADREVLPIIESAPASAAREWAPVLIAAMVAIPLAAAWSHAPMSSWMAGRNLCTVAALAGLARVVQWIAPGLQARIALAPFSPLRGAVASLTTAAVLALALASAGAALR